MSVVSPHLVFNALVVIFLPQSSSNLVRMFIVVMSRISELAAADEGGINVDFQIELLYPD